MSDAAAPHPYRERRRLADARVPGWQVDYLEATGSTNAVAAADPQDHRVVVTDHQTAGRGRLDRIWETPAGVALTMSAVLDPGLPDRHWPWLPLVTGLAVRDAITAAGGVASLKWPNDVLWAGAGEPGKLAGILVERVPGPLAVIGIGINVGQGSLPLPTATSLAREGVNVDRADLLAAVLAALDGWVERLRRNPDSVRQAYAARCGSVGRDLTVHLPGGATRSGRGSGIDAQGRLLVTTPDGPLAVSAADVVHLR